MPTDRPSDPIETLWALALSINVTTDRLDEIKGELAGIRQELAAWRQERAAAVERGRWVKDVDGIHPLRPEGETDSPDTR